MKQAERERKAEKERQARIRKGFLGFIDRLTGKRKKTLELNHREAEQDQLRDHTEQTTLRMAQAKSLKTERKATKHQAARHKEIRIDLQRDIRWLETPFKNASEGKKPITRNHGRKRNRETPNYEPEP